MRGNGKIIQELEGIFRGAGWNVIKVIWGDDWDALLAQRRDRPARQADGRGRRRRVSEIHRHARLLYPRALLRQVSASCRRWSATCPTRKLKKLRRGGHDPEKVYAAYKAAVERKGRPTVILAKTIKGYGLGEVGEGRNTTHQQKKLNEDELREFRSRFGIPISDDEVAKDAPFYRPADDTPEMKYLQERRRAAGRIRAGRPMVPLRLKTPKLEDYQALHREERRPRGVDHDRRGDADEPAC